MADEVFYSSQSSEYDRHQILTNQENVQSSPILLGQKEKRPPTVTPKRFTKFFTPRSSVSSRGARQSKSGRQLRDITRTGGNRRLLPTPLQSLDGEVLEGRPLKRRKHSVEICSSPPQSSPIKRVHIAEEVDILEDVASPSSVSDTYLIDLFEDLRPFPKPVRRIRQSLQSHSVLERSFGGYDALGRGRRNPNHAADWRATTANFVTTHVDAHIFTGRALPFCTTSCHTNSLIAIGEEEGGVRLVDPSPSAAFGKTHVQFRPHQNAIMDVAFSSDDSLLATASGDQTARIIDIQTRQTICIMSGHTSTVKQVRFQPSDDNIIATSSRDGSVQIWDMRCGVYGSVASLRTAFARNADNGGNEPNVHYAKYRVPMGFSHRSTTAKPMVRDITDSGASVSITSLEYLPNGRDNLLVTASELNSSLKLWDLRNIARRGVAVPASCTVVPKSHGRFRNYGLNSLCFSSNGARLYAACRDGAVYAYSTNHLILGSAPEMALPNSTNSRARMGRETKAGIGALYAFRHASLRNGSFYIKSALRQAKDDKSEMLAVGSSNNCAVLFPTDERHLPLRERPSVDEDDDDEDVLPSLAPKVQPKHSNTADADDLHVYNQGTALVNGHMKEVTGLTWTYDGELVTLGDDSKARCWRENGGSAKELRKWKEGRKETWLCGWAEMDEEWDEDDG